MTTEIDALLQQAADLRETTLTAVKERRGAVNRKEHELKVARTDLTRVVRAALSMGIERETLAQLAGVSASTIGTWASEAIEEPKSVSAPEPEPAEVAS